MIMIMTTITWTKADGGCEGMAHPGVGTTCDGIMIMSNAITRSSLTTTSAPAMVVMMAMLAAVWGGLT
jgi:hypothetical protein